MTTLVNKMHTQKQLLTISGAFLCGAFFLVTMASMQRYFIIGVNPFIAGFKGLLVPILTGGIFGATIGTYILKIRQLNVTLQQRVHTLENFLPICSHCKKIRKADADPEKVASWEQIETYIASKTSSQFSHGVCPDCKKEFYSDIEG